MLSRNVKQTLQFTTVLIVGLAVSPRPADAAPIALYHLDEASGNALDSSGNSRTATNAGGVTLGVPGPSGYGVGNKAYQFDGIDDQTTRTVDAAFTPGTFSANTGRTVETWIKVAPGNTYAAGFVSWYALGGGSPSFQLMLDGSGHPRGWVRDDAGNSVFLTSSIDIRDSGWHHLALTFGHNGSNLPFRNFYLDGALAGSDTSTALTALSTNADFTIGWFNGFPGDDRWINATIDEVAYYNTALSAAQIQLDYLAGVPVPEPGTGTLMLCGLAAVMVRKRRRRRATA